MLYVEDVLLIMADKLSNDAYNGITMDEWHERFIENVGERIQLNNPLSTEQSKIILKLLVKIKDKLIDSGAVSEQEITELLLNPVHKLPPYPSANIKKEVRFLGANYIGFRFKFNDLIMRDIRSLLNHASKPWFDRDFRIWIIPVTSINIKFLREIIQKHRFEMDTSIRDYLTLCESSVHKSSTFFVEDDKIVCKIRDNDVLINWVKQVAGGEWS